MKVVGKDKVIRVGMMEHVKREISVMKMVTHTNIVELHEVMATRSKICFAMELVRSGELFSKITRSGRPREDTALHYFRQLISAVDFCHPRGVYHRDLKPDNLLLDDAGDHKVADFGLSAFADHLRPDGLLHTTCSTPAYIASAVIGKKGYDGARADLWSCGVIFFDLCRRNPATGGHSQLMMTLQRNHLPTAITIESPPHARLKKEEGKCCSRKHIILPKLRKNKYIGL